MPADVYANDDDLREGVRDIRPVGTATFTVVADADADLIARVGAVLNLLNVMPRAFQLEAQPAGTATVTAQVHCAQAQAELVGRKLQRLTSVREVVVEYAGA